MSKIENRLGRVGLCVTAACAAMAFVASAAQSEPPEWMLGATNISANTTVSAKVAPDLIEFENGAGTDMVNALLLLSKTSLGAPIWISCKKAEASSITLEAEGKAKGKVKFEECVTSLLNASKQMALTPLCSPQKVIEAGALVSLLLHEKVAYAKIEGEGAKNLFTTIEFPNEECSLNGQKYEVKGWVLLKDSEGKFEVEQLTHLFEEAMTQTLALGGGLTFGANSASVDGSGIVEMSQSGAMRTFNGLTS
jgi:hypothetical protein